MTRVPQTTRQILNTIHQLESLQVTLRSRLRSDSAGESLKIRKVAIDVASLIQQLDVIAGKMTTKTGSSVEEVKAKLKEESGKRRSGQLRSSDACEEPVAKSAKAADLKGVMVALYPPADVAKRIAVKGGESAQNLHVTCVYFEDKAADRDDWDTVKSIVEHVAAGLKPIVGTLTGTGRFVQEDGGEVDYATVELPGVDELHDQLVEMCEAAGFPVSKKHAWRPHLTLRYAKADEPFPDTPLRTETIPVLIKTVEVVCGDRKAASFPLGSSE